MSQGVHPAVAGNTRRRRRRVLHDARAERRVGEGKGEMLSLTPNPQQQINTHQPEQRESLLPPASHRGVLTGLHATISGPFRTLCVHPASSIWVYRTPRSLFTPSSSSPCSSTTGQLQLPLWAGSPQPHERGGHYFLVPQTSDQKSQVSRARSSAPSSPAPALPGCCSLPASIQPSAKQ